MLLAIDVGNTNIVLAVYEGQEQKEQCRIETQGNISEIVNMIAQKYPDICSVIISSVVPKADAALKKYCQYFLKSDPIFVDYKNAGIKIAIDNPKELGADRLVAATAAIAHYKVPVVIVDFGTATTFDVIDLNGRYCGGVIAPGINLSLEALHNAAAKLPGVAIEKPAKIIGTNTVEAMQSGIYWGYIGLIEGTIQRVANEMEAKPLVIATGGLATLFSSGTDRIDMIDPDLIMKGLVHIYAQLCAQKGQEENTQDAQRKTA